MQGYRVTLEGKACLALKCYEKTERETFAHLLLFHALLSYQNVTFSTVYKNILIVS